MVILHCFLAAITSGIWFLILLLRWACIVPIGGWSCDACRKRSNKKQSKGMVKAA
jgi:hypothetical protein